MNLLAESEHYIVYNEYENVLMEIKGVNRKIKIVILEKAFFYYKKLDNVYLTETVIIKNTNACF